MVDGPESYATCNAKAGAYNLGGSILFQKRRIHLVQSMRCAIYAVRNLGFIWCNLRGLPASFARSSPGQSPQKGSPPPKKKRFAALDFRRVS
eukprot:6762799-Pyramimonas_sp.AAC.1